MAPNGEALFMDTFPSSKNITGSPAKPRRPSTDSGGLQRAISDLSLELSKSTMDGPELPPIAEVAEDAKCECCGMSEECTPEYIRRVRDRFCGRWVCGLCSEAVKEEMLKNGGRRDEALAAHTSMCMKFNKFGRTHPVLFQAEAMRQVLRKYRSVGDKGSGRIKTLSPRDKGDAKKGPGIARSSSCIPSITKEMNERITVIAGESETLKTAAGSLC